MREDAKKGVYVENLTEVEVLGLQDVIQLLLQVADFLQLLVVISETVGKLRCVAVPGGSKPQSGRNAHEQGEQQIT